jgi:hypothetical protein
VESKESLKIYTVNNDANMAAIITRTKENTVDLANLTHFTKLVLINTNGIAMGTANSDIVIESSISHGINDKLAKIIPAKYANTIGPINLITFCVFAI